MKTGCLASLLLALLALADPTVAAPPTAKPSVVVTTTLIETAVRDLMGASIPVTRLMPPGSCPGHFDLAPGQIKQLSAAALFIRHDFQAGLDAGVAKSGLATNRVVSIVSRPAFTIPGSYVAMCEELADRLVQTWPDQADSIDARLDALTRQATNEERRVSSRVTRLRGRKVLCARYQRDFCQWLGVETAAVFQIGTDDSAWQLSRAVDMARTGGAQAVIGNLQWGPRHLHSLTEATGLPGIMLSNFPENGEAGAYWRLLTANVDAMLAGLP